MNKTRLKTTLEGIAILSFAVGTAVCAYNSAVPLTMASNEEFSQTNLYMQGNYEDFIKQFDEEGDSPFKDE